MTSHSRMHRPHLVRCRQVISQDRFTHVTIYRNDVQIADVQARVAQANGSTVGRDRQDVRGDSSPNFYVMALRAQIAQDGVVVQGDEAWTTERRYRIVSVDVYGHEAQVLMRHIQ